ncbi:MAG: flagellar hook-length control protein FliK [Xanthobacteraceae bacterium]
MAQVQFEFSKIKAPDPSHQTRARVSSLPGTHDFASLIDDDIHDGVAKAAPVDIRSTRNDHYSEGPSRRTDPSAPRDRFTSDRVDRAGPPSRLGDDSRPRAADRAVDKAEADNASEPRRVATKRNEGDEGTGETDSDGDTAAATGATSETVPATAPGIAPAPLNTPDPDEMAADKPTVVDAAATTTMRSGLQTKEADATSADAEGGQVRESSRLAALLAALPQRKPGAETAVKDNEDSEALPPKVTDADAAPESSAKAEKMGKDRKIFTEGAEGKAGAAAALSGEETGVDEQPQSPEPHLSDAAKSHDTREPSHKDTHDKTDGAARGSEKKESSDEAPRFHANELRTGSAQTTANTGSASPGTPAGAQAAIGAIGSVSAGTASAASPAAASSRSEAASAAVPLTDVGVAIATQAKGGHRSFDIRLDPADLGHIHVRLDVDRDGNVISRLFVDRAETLDLLRRDAPQLERALQDAGLKADAQTMQFSLRDQHAGQQGGHASSHSAARTTDLDGGNRLDEAPQSHGRSANRTGGLDIRI